MEYPKMKFKHDGVTFKVDMDVSYYSEKDGWEWTTWITRTSPNIAPRGSQFAFDIFRKRNGPLFASEANAIRAATRSMRHAAEMLGWEEVCDGKE